MNWLVSADAETGCYPLETGSILAATADLPPQIKHELTAARNSLAAFLGGVIEEIAKSLCRTDEGRYVRLTSIANLEERTSVEIRIGPEADTAPS